MRDRSPVEIYDNYLIPQVIENTSRGERGFERLAGDGAHCMKCFGTVDTRVADEKLAGNGQRRLSCRVFLTRCDMEWMLTPN